MSLTGPLPDFKGQESCQGVLRPKWGRLGGSLMSRLISLWLLYLAPPQQHSPHPQPEEWGAQMCPIYCPGHNNTGITGLWGSASHLCNQAPHATGAVVAESAADAEDAGALPHQHGGLRVWGAGARHTPHLEHRQRFLRPPSPPFLLSWTLSLPVPATDPSPEGSWQGTRSRRLEDGGLECCPGPLLP